MKLKFAALSLMLGCAAILGACAEAPTDSVETPPINESVKSESEIREKSAEMGTSLGDKGDKEQFSEVGADLDSDKAIAPDGAKSSEIPEESAGSLVIEETEVQAEPAIEETEMQAQPVTESDSSVKSEQLKDEAVLEMKEVEIPADAQLTQPTSPDADPNSIELPAEQTPAVPEGSSSN